MNKNIKNDLYKYGVVNWIRSKSRYYSHMSNLNGTDKQAMQFVIDNPHVIESCYPLLDEEDGLSNIASIFLSNNVNVYNTSKFWRSKCKEVSGDLDNILSNSGFFGWSGRDRHSIVCYCIKIDPSFNWEKYVNTVLNRIKVGLYIDESLEDGAYSIWASRDYDGFSKSLVTGVRKFPWSTRANVYKNIIPNQKKT